MPGPLALIGAAAPYAGEAAAWMGSSWLLDKLLTSKQVGTGKGHRISPDKAKSLSEKAKANKGRFGGKVNIAVLSYMLLDQFGPDVSKLLMDSIYGESSEEISSKKLQAQMMSQNLSPTGGGDTQSLILKMLRDFQKQQQLTREMTESPSERQRQMQMMGPSIANDALYGEGRDKGSPYLKGSPEDERAIQEAINYASVSMGDR